MTMNPIVYLVLRLAIGASFFGHGLVRLPKLKMFSDWMVGAFAKSMLPQGMVRVFSYALPLLEFAVGLLCILGLFTQPALVVGCLVMISLIFGCCMIENWEPIASQLIHILVFAALLQFLGSNNWALDNLFQ